MNELKQTDAKRWLSLGITVLATLMVVLDASIINIALPQAQKDLLISDANRHWLVTAYAVAFGGLLLLGGKLADNFGRRRVFIVGLAGFAGASILGGIAQSANILFVARAIQGTFAAALAPAALALINVSFTAPEERAKAFGLYGAVQGLGGALGLILGGIITEYLNWRWCMFINVPIAIFAVIMAIFHVGESKATGIRHYDIPGTILATLGAIGLIFGFTQAAETPTSWTKTPTILTLIISLLLLFSFVVLQTKKRYPLVPPRIVTDRNRGGSFLIAALVGAGMFGMLIFLTYFLQENLGLTPLRTGFAFLPFTFSIILMAMVVSTFLPRTGPKLPIVTGMVLATAGMLLLTRLNPVSTYWSIAFPAKILMGFGLGLVFVPTNSTALAGVEADDAGVASALLDTTQQMGGAIGVALLNTLYTTSVSLGLINKSQDKNDALFAGYRIAFTTGCILFFAALLTAVWLIKSKRLNTN